MSLPPQYTTGTEIYPQTCGEGAFQTNQMLQALPPSNPTQWNHHQPQINQHPQQYQAQPLPPAPPNYVAPAGHQLIPISNTAAYAPPQPQLPPASPSYVPPAGYQLVPISNPAEYPPQAQSQVVQTGGQIPYQPPPQQYQQSGPPSPLQNFGQQQQQQFLPPHQPPYSNQQFYQHDLNYQQDTPQFVAGSYKSGGQGAEYQNKGIGFQNEQQSSYYHGHKSDYAPHQQHEYSSYPNPYSQGHYPHEEWFKGSRKVPDDDSESDRKKETARSTKSSVKAKKPNPNAKKSRGSSSEEDEEVVKSSSKKKGPKKPPKKALDIVSRPKELVPLGKMEDLSKTDDVYKAIAKYVKNSSGMETSVETKIHKIVEFQNMISTKTGASSKTKGQNRMLLWFKTTPASVSRLATSHDGCIAFYDRLGRVLAINPKKLKEPLRQTILLCSVSLGKVHKSPNGYKHWAARGVPQGQDSIKAIGKFTPDWSLNEEHNSTTIPCGKTKKHGQFTSYELDYSEYIIQEVRRAKARYAVDVEFIPGEEDEDEEEEDESSEEESD